MSSEAPKLLPNTIARPLENFRYPLAMKPDASKATTAELCSNIVDMTPVKLDLAKFAF